MKLRNKKGKSSISSENITAKLGTGKINDSNQIKGKVFLAFSYL